MKSGSVERNSPQLRSVVYDFFGEVEEITPDSGITSTVVTARSQENKAAVEEARDMMTTDYDKNMLLKMNTSNDDRLSLNDNHNFI